MHELYKHLWKPLCVSGLIFFITLFFPLYFSQSSPVVWIKNTLLITDVLLRPPSFCILGFHYAICEELQINLYYYHKNTLYNCSIDISDNVSEIYNFYSMKNLTSVPGYYSTLTNKCREVYYEPYFVFGFLLLNIFVLATIIYVMRQRYKSFYTIKYNRDMSVLLTDNTST